MRKGIGLLICMALLFSFAAAEQTVALPESRYVIDVPDGMIYSAPETGDNGVQAYYSDTLEMDYLSYSREEAAALGMQPTLLETAEKLKERGTETELREINGIEVLVYHLTDDTDGAPGIGYVVADGDRFTEIIFWYADMNAAETARAIMETIRIKE